MLTNKIVDIDGPIRQYDVTDHLLLALQLAQVKTVQVQQKIREVKEFWYQFLNMKIVLTLYTEEALLVCVLRSLFVKWSFKITNMLCHSLIKPLNIFKILIGCNKLANNLPTKDVISFYYYYLGCLFILPLSYSLWPLVGIQF